MTRWTYDELTEGREIRLGQKTVDREEIIAFARQFDPQPMHLEEAAGEASILGGLSASGWHTCAMFMRLLCDGMLLDSTSQGSPGLDYVRWKRPVLAGDVVSGTCVVTGRRLSRSRPTLGLVTIRSALSNQRGETVLELENTAMFLTREALK